MGNFFFDFLDLIKQAPALISPYYYILNIRECEKLNHVATLFIYYYNIVLK